MHSVLYKKTKFDRLYTILQKNGGTDTKAMGQTEKKFSPTLHNIYKKQHGARPCVEKMQLIFFVPPNEELEVTLHPQKCGCTPKNEGKRVHVPPDEKTCGHAEIVTVELPSL